MVNTAKVRGLIVENGYKMSDVASFLGISQASLHRRLEKGIFKSDEIEILIERLHIADPMAVFFTQ